jgi:hypothetical protein
MSATPRGDLPRNEGRRNFPYGPQGGRHARKSLFNLGSNTYDKYGAARLRGGPDHSRDAAKRVLLTGMTRDELRAVCKAQNVTGYGKMNKAELVEAALR